MEEGGRLTTATSRVRRGSLHVGSMLVSWVLLPAPRRHRLFIWKNTSSSLLSTLLPPSPLLSPSLCLSLSPYIAFPERILNLYSFRTCNYNQPQQTLIKKENQIFLIYKEIQSGAIAKRKGFVKYEEMSKYFPRYMRTQRRPLVIYMTLQQLHSEFP